MRLCPSILSLELLIKATPARHEALPVNHIARSTVFLSMYINVGGDAVFKGNRVQVLRETGGGQRDAGGRRFAGDERRTTGCGQHVATKHHYYIGSPLTSPSTETTVSDTGGRQDYESRDMARHGQDMATASSDLSFCSVGVQTPTWDCGRDGCNVGVQAPTCDCERDGCPEPFAAFCHKLHQK